MSDIVDVAQASRNPFVEPLVCFDLVPYLGKAHHSSEFFKFQVGPTCTFNLTMEVQVVSVPNNNTSFGCHIWYDERCGIRVTP